MGVNKTVIELLALAPKVEVGLVVILNCEALVPLKVIVLMLKVPEPAF